MGIHIGEKSPTHTGATFDVECQAERIHEAKASLTALCALARLHQIAADPAALAHQLGLAKSRHIRPEELLLAAKHLSLKAKLSTCALGRLHLAALPALAEIREALPDGGLAD